MPLFDRQRREERQRRREEAQKERATRPPLIERVAVSIVWRLLAKFWPWLLAAAVIGGGGWAAWNWWKPIVKATSNRVEVRECDCRAFAKKGLPACCERCGCCEVE